jgi:hypothetical protein
MLKWLSTREADEFAKTIVSDLTKRVPPAGVDLADRKALKKLLRTQNSIFDQVNRFAQNHTPNMYQKASFGNTVKWALKEAGYTSEAVDAWTHELLTYLTLASKRKA